MNTQENTLNGALFKSLTRKNSQIRGDRAESIAEQIELQLKRQVEDLSLLIKTKIREQKNLMDMSPESKDSLTFADRMDAKLWTDQYLKAGRDIRENGILLEIAQKAYDELFTPTTETKKEDN